MLMKTISITDKNKKVLTGILYKVVFPLILLLYPLMKSNIGVDYMDSMYSPGNFVFFQDMEGTWVVATYLANAIGFMLTKHPGAGTYLGLRIYTNLFVSALALISYFWLSKRIRIPAWIVAVGEIIAIGFCWCPTTILYNYLTYLFMLLSLICLYEGLTQNKKCFLILAGICLGANLLVRFPNVIEVGFILAVWFYDFLKKKKVGEIVQDTIWCMFGYFVSVGVLMGIIIISYGLNAYVDMIGSLFSMTDSAASYKPVEMILSVIREYWNGLKWPVGMALYALVMTGVFQIAKDRFIWAKRGVTLVGILVLFRWYYGQGMFNVNYHTYPSMFQWVTCFLIVTICVFGVELLSKKVKPEQKLMCCMLLLVIAITPIGSNNNLFPIMNNLFLVAPVSIYFLYQFIFKLQKNRYTFPVCAMIAAMVLAVLIQSIGFGSTFVFRGAREGEKRDTKIERNDILKGMYTNAEKAQAIDELSVYWEERPGSGESKLLLFGHIPGVSYFLNTPCAIPHSWPDLPSYAYGTFERDMLELQERINEKGETKPVVIVSYGVNAVITDDATAMDWYANNMESGEEPLDRMLSSEKLAYLREFLQEFEYEQTFSNQRFVVYE